ncbi:MAG TPA: hybrid sensor histidine kinase/response regulator [Methanomicrobia archaeon]|nr:hybrid sensor histidine kinase/response regulator [Methanomicrobia archaeon]
MGHTMRIFSRLSHKLLITFLLISVLPISIAGLYSVNLATESFESMTLENTQYDLYSSAEEIYDFINYNKSDVIFLSKDPALRDYFYAKATHSETEIERWRSLLQEHILIFCQSREIYDKVAFINEDGEEVLRIENDGDQFQKTSYDMLVDVSNRQYFQETMDLEKDQIFVTASSTDPSTKTTLVTYATPVYDETNIKRGIIVATMPADYFLKPIRESYSTGDEPQQRSAIFLISNNNVYLTHRVGEEIDPGEIVEIATFVLSGNKDITSGDSGTITDKEDWIVTYTPLFFEQVMHEEFLVLVEVIPKNVVFSNVASFRQAFILLIASAVLISIIAAVMVTQTITRPLRDLVRGTRRIALKDLSYQISVPSDDEFGFLARSFNEMASELQNSYAALEDKVKERTRRLQLSNERLKAIVYELREANKKTREASRLKSQFIANISHELRTPLNAIIGFSDVLLDDENLDDEQQDYLHTILRNSENLLQLINDMLDLSKIEANRMEVVYQKVKIDELIKRIYKLLSPLAKEKNVTMVIENEVAPEIEIDKTKLRQILINLLTNAIKFNKEGGLVKTTVSYLEEDSDYIRIEVMDTGIGIEEEDFDVIFDEFRQIDGTETRDFEGTGLGLAITKKYVEMLKGCIWVESALGEGSKFIFTLPTSPREEE